MSRYPRIPMNVSHVIDVFKWLNVTLSTYNNKWISRGLHITMKWNFTLSTYTNEGVSCCSHITMNECHVDHVYQWMEKDWQ